MLPYTTPRMGSYKAGADLSAKQYHFVKAGTNPGEVVAIAAVTDIPLGILMNAPAAGETADVALPGGGGKLKLAASSSGTPSGGALMTFSAAGLGVAAANVADIVAAQVDATGGAAANSDVVPVLVMHATKAPNIVSASVGAMTAKSPETDAEAGFLTISVGGTQYEVPFYAKV